MKRRLFLVMLLACAANGVAHARVQQPSPEAPSDRITVEEFTRLRAAGQVLVLDVRSQIDRKIKGALHMPYNDIGSRAGELPRDREIVTYCA